MENKRKLLGFLIYSSIVLIPIIVYSLASQQKNSQKNNNKAQVLSRIISEPTEIPKNILEELAQKYLLNSNDKYAVVIKNLKTGESYLYNENEKFNSASLYKLWVMAVAFGKIKDGTLDEEDVLSLPIDYLENTLSTTTPTPTPEGQTPTPSPGEPELVEMKTEDAIEKMITISDNFAALLVASASGNFSVTNFLRKYEFEDSSFAQPPTSTAGDIALFFEKLYKGEIIDKFFSEKMIGILKEQALNDRIPKYLPETVEIAHKTGELFDFKHDAGIVFGDKGDYIIVVLSESEDPKKASERIAVFSKEVYKYFEKL